MPAVGSPSVRKIMRGILPTLEPLSGSWLLWFSTEAAASRAALMLVPNWRVECETIFSSYFYPHCRHTGHPTNLPGSVLFPYLCLDCFCSLSFPSPPPPQGSLRSDSGTHMSLAFITRHIRLCSVSLGDLSFTSRIGSSPRIAPPPPCYRKRKG